MAVAAAPLDAPVGVTAVSMELSPADAPAVATFETPEPTAPFIEASARPSLVPLAAPAPLASLETVDSFQILEREGPVHSEGVLVSPLQTWSMADSGPEAPAPEQPPTDAAAASAGGGNAPAAAGEGAVAAAVAARAAAILALTSQTSGADGNTSFAVCGK